MYYRFQFLHSTRRTQTLLIWRSQVDSKSGANKKGTERLLFGVNFTPFFTPFFGVIFTP
jgi:hypothetical protein